MEGFGCFYDEGCSPERLDMGAQPYRTDVFPSRTVEERQESTELHVLSFLRTVEPHFFTKKRHSTELQLQNPPFKAATLLIPTSLTTASNSSSRYSPNPSNSNNSPPFARHQSLTTFTRQLNLSSERPQLTSPRSEIEAGNFRSGKYSVRRR